MPSFADHDCTVGHSKVACDRSLASDHSCYLSFGTCWTTEETHLQHAVDIFDGFRELFNLPLAIFTITHHVSREVLADQQRIWERGVNDEEVLVCLDGSSLGHVPFSNGGAVTLCVAAAEELQSHHHLPGGLGFDFDWDGWPLGNQTFLKFSMIFGR